MADRLSAWMEEGCAVHAYFNNDYEGHAVEDARWLAERLGAARPPAARDAQTATGASRTDSTR